MAARPSLSEQVSALLDDKLAALERGQIEVKKDVEAANRTLELLAGKFEGQNGMEQRVRVLEEDRAAMRFVSHPIFVGIAMLVVGGLATNAFTSWRDLATLRDTSIARGPILEGVEHRLRALEDAQVYYHGRSASGLRDARRSSDD